MLLNKLIVFLFEIQFPVCIDVILDNHSDTLSNSKTCIFHAVGSPHMNLFYKIVA